MRHGRRAGRDAARADRLKAASPRQSYVEHQAGGAVGGSALRKSGTDSNT